MLRCQHERNGLRLKRCGTSVLTLQECVCSDAKPTYRCQHTNGRDLIPKSTVGTMDGYSLDSKAYRILHRDKIGRMTVSEFRNVSFDEHSKGLFIDPLSYGSGFSDVPGNIGELPPANQVADHVGVTPGQHPAVTAPIPALMVVPPPGDEGSIDGVKAALMGHMACKPVDLHLTQLT